MKKKKFTQKQVFAKIKQMAKQAAGDLKNYCSAYEREQFIRGYIEGATIMYSIMKTNYSK